MWAAAHTGWFFLCLGAGTRDAARRQPRGFHPRTPGYFPLVGKVTKGTRRGRGISVSLSPFEPPLLETTLQGGPRPPRQRGYPPCCPGPGCTTRTRVMVQIRHCDDHTGVCSHLGRFHSRPRGEWLFVEVRIRPPRESWGGWGAVAPEEPRAAAARCNVIEVEQLSGLAGIIQKGGRRPLLVGAGGGS